MPDENKNETIKIETEETPKKKLIIPDIPPVVTHHQITVEGKALAYTAAAGVMPLKDPDKDEIVAGIFYTAYTLDGVADTSTRPMVFVFNGGPGSSSVWLHLGAIGPRRVKMEDEGWMPRPPFRLEDNVYTWLGSADLVFIDPVGTGFSRAAEPDRLKDYWSVDNDLKSVGEFIRLFL